VELGDHHDVRPGVVRSNGGAHAGATGTHHEDIVLCDHR
jgi:hypothetical protein